MSRPPFMITDDQARILVQRVGPLLEQHPLNPNRRDHRPFCGSFIRAVYEATGKLYGPDIYRRLLKAYAPGRSPSTPTLVSERAALEHEIKQEKAEASRSFGAGGAADTALAGDRVRGALAEFLPQLARLVSQPGRDGEVGYLTARLDAAEHARNDAQAQAARLGAQLQEQTARTELLSHHVTVLQAALEREQELVKRLAEEMAGQRTFALNAIEASRAESRQYKERAASFEHQVRVHETTIDHMRIARSSGGGQR